MSPRTSILDKPLSRGKGEVSLSIFALLFSEIVQYSQSRVLTVPELQNRWDKLNLIQYISKMLLEFIQLIQTFRSGKRCWNTCNRPVFRTRTQLKA